MTPPAGIGACLYHGIQCRDAPSNARRGAAAISNFLRARAKQILPRKRLCDAHCALNRCTRSLISHTRRIQRTLLRELRMVLSDEGIDEGFGLIALGIDPIGWSPSSPSSFPSGFPSGSPTKQYLVTRTRSESSDALSRDEEEQQGSSRRLGVCRGNHFEQIYEDGAVCISSTSLRSTPS